MRASIIGLLVLVGFLLPGLAHASASAITVTMEGKFFEGEPQSVIVVPVSIESRSDVPMVVTFEWVDFPEGWTAPTPNRISLKAVTLREPAVRSNLMLTVLTPYENGRNDDTAQFRMRVSAAPEKGASAPVEVTTLTFVVHSEGMYVPAPPFASMLLAIGAVALHGAGRRHQLSKLT